MPLYESVANGRDKRLDGITSPIYTSDDILNPTSPTSVDVVQNNESLPTFFNKITNMFKNTRYLLKMLGETPITLGDNTVTGAIDTLNSNLSAVDENINVLNNFKTFKNMNIGGKVYFAKVGRICLVSVNYSTRLEIGANVISTITDPEFKSLTFSEATLMTGARQPLGSIVLQNNELRLSNSSGAVYNGYVVGTLMYITAI